MGKLLARSWVCLLVLLTDCITPFVPPTTSTSRRLVVNGVITNQPGPYTVRLTTTSNTSTTLFNDYPINAHVFIRDNTGYQEELTEVKSGTFETSPNGIQGVVGLTYSVTVVLQDGRRYESTPEKLKAVSSLDNIYTNYKDLPFGSKTVGQFETYIETVDPLTTDDYYRWTWKHYSFRTHCLYFFSRGIQERYPCCEKCWDIEQCENCITILSDKLGNGKKINQFLLNIPYDSKDPYFLSIQQLSLSADAYKFWKTLSDQINNVGGVFDPPPAPLRGNLFNVSNRDEQVLGYFGASGLSALNVYVRRDNIERPPITPFAVFTVVPTPCQPCVDGYFRTKQKPEGWIE